MTPQTSSRSRTAFVGQFSLGVEEIFRCAELRFQLWHGPHHQEHERPASTAPADREIGMRFWTSGNTETAFEEIGTPTVRQRCVSSNGNHAENSR